MNTSPNCTKEKKKLEKTNEPIMFLGKMSIYSKNIN